MPGSNTESYTQGLEPASDGPTRAQQLGMAVLILAVLALLNFQANNIIEWAFPAATGYTRWGLRMALEVTGCVLAVMAMYRAGLMGALERMALIQPTHSALAIALVATLPMLLTFGSGSAWTPSANPLDLLYYMVLSPFAEEVLFRGFAFWMLYRYARLGFWASALLPAAVFAADHMDQSDALMEQTGIIAITGLGSVWISWLLMRWQNLWVPIWLHVLMNGWWMLFDVDGTALGDGAATMARVATVLVSIALTVWKARLPSWLGGHDGMEAMADNRGSR